MAKIPFNPANLASLGRRRHKFIVLQLFLSLTFCGVTLNHCINYAKNIRDNKIKEIRSEIAAVSQDGAVQERLLAIYNLEKTS